MNIINPSIPEKSKTSDVEITGEKICKNMTPIHKIKMTFGKHETNVGNLFLEEMNLLLGKATPKGKGAIRTLARTLHFTVQGKVIGPDARKTPNIRVCVWKISVLLNAHPLNVLVS